MAGHKPWPSGFRAGLLAFALGWAIAACARATSSAPPLAELPPAVHGSTATADVQASVLNTPGGSAFGASPTPPYELGVGQHIAAGGSYTANETDAAGPMVCQIERNSCAFSYLVSVSDPGIRFLQEELPPYNDEDRLMNPAMVAPLSRLAEMVTAEWNGKYQLTVTDAYDSLLEHDLAQPDAGDKYSLHFEGRSVDLILVPLGLEPLGRLCALAHQAGFDWVHNESDHCHASVRADSLCSICSGSSTP